MKRLNLIPPFGCLATLLATALLISLAPQAAQASNVAVTYTQQQTEYPTTWSSSGGNFNQGTTQYGLWAHGGSPGSSSQSVAWRTFLTAGNVGSGTARKLQVGDVFALGVSATRAYGEIGFSLDAGGTSGSSWANRTNGSRLYVNLEGPDNGGSWGSWYASANGVSTALLNGSSYCSGNQGSWHDFYFNVRITSTNTADVWLLDNTSSTTYVAYNLTMGGTANIDTLAVYLQDDWDGGANQNIYWEQPAYVTNSGIVNLGYYLTSGTFTPGLIPDGLEADSTSINSPNSINVGGNAATVVILNQPNTFTGTATVNANATALLANNTGFGSASGGAVSVTSGGGILLSNAITVASTKALTLNGAGTNSNGALENWNGNNTWSGAITLGSATRINSDSSLLTLNSSTAISSGYSLTFGGSGNVEVDSAITTGANTLTKDGSGTLTLTGANTYSSGTTLSAGTLQLGKGGASGSPGSGTISIANGATLLFNRSDSPTFSTALSLTGSSGSHPTFSTAAGTTTTLTGSITSSGGEFWVNDSSNGGTLIVNNTANAFNVSVVVQNGVLQVGDLSNSGSTSSLGKGGIYLKGSSTATLRYTGATAASDRIGAFAFQTANSGSIIDVYSAGTTLTLSQALSESSGSGFTKAGAGTLALSGTSTYTGPTAISNGTLTVTGSGQLNSGSYAGNITNYSAFTYNSSAAQTLSGVISGTGALTQLGSGTLTLSGANTYSGNTTISAGTLALSGSGVVPAASVNLTIAGGATFDVSAVGYTLASGQTLKASGSSTAGTVTTASGKNLTMGATSGLNFTAYDGVHAPLTVSSGGTLTLASGNVVTVYNTGSALGIGTYTLISAGVGGTAPSSVTINGNGKVSGTSASLSISGGALLLNVTCPTITFSTSKTDNTSCGGSAGSITVNSVSGGSGSYTYSDNNGASYQSGNQFTGLASGGYQVVVKDSNSGCTSSAATVTIADPSGPSLSLTETNVTCNGGSDGKVTATFSGSGPFQVKIDAGSYATQTSPYTFTGLTQGSHSVTVQDNNGCTTSQAITVNQPAAITFGTSPVNVACNGGASGSITVTSPAGGSGAGYTYSDNNGSSFQSGATFSGLAAGTYNIVVKDSNACLSSATPVAITQPASALSCSVTPSSATLCAGGSQTFTASGSGGTASYTYSWTGPNGHSASTAAITISSAQSADAGTYTCTVTDANNCTSTCTATLTVNSAPSSPSVSISPGSTVCAGSQATFSVSTSGGSPTGYAWRKRDPSAGWGTGNNWVFTYNSTACDGWNGVFIGSATAASQSPGINNNGQAFGLYANTWNAAEAKRDFGSLAIGQNISFDLQIPVTLTGNDGSGNNSQALFALRNSANEANPRLEMWVLAGDSYVTISDGTGNESATVPYDSNGYHCVFQLTGQNTYNLTVKRLSTSTVYTYTGRSLKGTANDPVNQVRAWLKNYDSTGGSAEDFYFNNIVAGACEDNAGNYTAGGCASTTWTTSPNLGFGPVSSSASYVISSAATADSGSYDVLVWDSCGQAFASPVTLTVNAIPSAPTAGNDSPVYGSTLHLTASAVTGATYAWTGPNGFASSLQNPTITNVTMAAAGQYSVTATANGCASSAGTTTVTVNKASATNNVAGSPNPSLPGANVTFTSTLGAVPPGAGTPTGTVLFKTNGVVLCDPVALDTNGVAAFITNSLPHGSNTVTAEYAGDSNFQGVTNSVVQVVNTPPIAPNTNAGTTQNQALVLANAKLLSLASDPDGDPLTITAAGPTSTNGGTVALASTTITYQPATNFIGTDLFSFVVSDPYGASATGTVLVAVASANLPSPNVVVPATYDSASGTFRVTFAGIPGYSYTIQSSPNVTGGPWTTLTNLAAGSNGWFEVIDAESPPPPARYYRTVYP